MSTDINQLVDERAAVGRFLQLLSRFDFEQPTFGLVEVAVHFEDDDRSFGSVTVEDLRAVRDVLARMKQGG